MCISVYTHQLPYWYTFILVFLEECILILDIFSSKQNQTHAFLPSGPNHLGIFQSISFKSSSVFFLHFRFPKTWPGRRKHAGFTSSDRKRNASNPWAEKFVPRTMMQPGHRTCRSCCCFYFCHSRLWLCNGLMLFFAYVPDIAFSIVPRVPDRYPDKGTNLDSVKHDSRWFFVTRSLNFGSLAFSTNLDIATSVAGARSEAGTSASFPAILRMDWLPIASTSRARTQHGHSTDTARTHWRRGFVGTGQNILLMNQYKFLLI